jgi:hypothetical protein
MLFPEQIKCAYTEGASAALRDLGLDEKKAAEVSQPPPLALNVAKRPPWMPKPYKIPQPHKARTQTA